MSKRFVKLQNVPFECIYLLPSDDIGGVEIAARSIQSKSNQKIKINCLYISNFGIAAPRHSRFLYSLECFYRRVCKYVFVMIRLIRLKPELLIASLWRSYMILIIYRLIRPSVPCVCFLHCEKNVHFVDWALSKTAMALSSEIWTDSRQTYLHRIPECFKSKAKSISFVQRRLKPVTSNVPLPRFMFWGRLANEKNLDATIQFIGRLSTLVDNLSFQIIGPDRGSLKHLMNLVAQNNLTNVVEFLGPMSFDQIANIATNSSFYLQTSLFEGMAVSVVEAMQLGLVPVVTPAGEIARYCRNNVNAIILPFDKPDTEAFRLVSLINNSSEYVRLKSKSVNTWNEESLYADDIMLRSQSLLGL